MSVFTHHFLGQMMNRTGFTLTHRSGCDASPAWFAHISPRYLCKTIAVEGIKR